MKFIVDVKESFGELIFLNVLDWKDYSSKQNRGVKLILGSTNTFEKIEVRIKDIKKEQFKSIEKRSIFNIEKLEANFWAMDGKKGLVFSTKMNTVK